MSKQFKLEREPAGESGVETKGAREALVRQFSEFRKNNQLAIVELLRSMLMRHGDKTLEQGINESSNLLDNAEQTKKTAANQPHEWHDLALLSSQENGAVGRTLTVREALKILEEEIQK